MGIGVGNWCQFSLTLYIFRGCIKTLVIIGPGITYVISKGYAELTPSLTQAKQAEQKYDFLLLRTGINLVPTG
ncbi:MAG: hypothetical protein COT45_01170 [bacterium (Candidatus Stahlbacteria) CG08_land_8_20_14_0_20_40_26]|nr:MAG: hypothetical protein COX49_04070 [bacterium (Candidatus Stahlbacteria) CG23_combo_of_CG06-09_8_20_14_all_40_9]PIS26130.1 MAG: hypothetical protein COT45_01170 [bacterium (Candidatus Stahlbacteria) CG08_land_8_20_14_0_20_40_26]